VAAQVVTPATSSHNRNSTPGPDPFTKDPPLSAPGDEERKMGAETLEWLSEIGIGFEPGPKSETVGRI
jgi:hypothetical protein